jgi:hypothetical protein
MKPVNFICPKCKERAGVAIRYGYPGVELIERSERNEVVLGGCVRTVDGAERQCLTCGNQWAIARRTASAERLCG